MSAAGWWSARRYRLLYGVLGTMLPFAAIALADVLDERNLLYDVPLYASVMLVGIISVPGWLVPFEGPVTLGIVALFWGAVGFLLGRHRDSKEIGGLSCTRTEGAPQRRGEAQDRTGPAHEHDA